MWDKNAGQDIVGLGIGSVLSWFEPNPIYNHDPSTLSATAVYLVYISSI